MKNLLAAFEQFKNSIITLENEMLKTNFSFAENYPFHLSFDELTIPTLDWVNTQINIIKNETEKMKHEDNLNMKLYSVSAPSDDIKLIVDTFMDDLTDLWLEGDELLIRCAVISAYRSDLSYISFELTDKQALLLMQTLFVYADRMADAGDNRQHQFFRFAIRLFAPLTGKTTCDF